MKATAKVGRLSSWINNSSLWNGLHMLGNLILLASFVAVSGSEDFVLLTRAVR